MSSSTIAQGPIDTVMYESPVIDGVSTGNITVVNIPEEIIVTNIYIDLVEVSGLVTPAVISLGQNISTYNNLVASTALTTLTTVNTVIPVLTNVVIPIMQSGANLVLKVITAALGTTYNFKCKVIGRKR